MATVDGFLRLRGKAAGMTYFKSKKGYQVRAIGGVSREKIMTLPSYQRLREHMAEFKTAAHAGKVIRTILRDTCKLAKDGSMSNRMTAYMLRIVKSDPISPRGSRTVSDGDISLLNGFDFNSNVRLAELLYAGYEASYTRATGDVTVDISSLIPLKQILRPLNATHYRFAVAASEIDLLTVFTKDVVTYSGYEEISIAQVPKTTITVALKPASTLPVVVSLAIEFFVEENGIKYDLASREFNSCMIMLVSKP